jgi:excisionase family DNA binding protein
MNAVLVQQQGQSTLSIYGPGARDPSIMKLYDAYLQSTGDANAAATLVLATVQAIAGPTVKTTSNEQPALRSEYLTVKQAASKYNLGERTIYRMVSDGLPVVRAGKAIRIRPRDLEKRLADSETILR